MLSAILPENFFKWFRKFSAPLPEDINSYLAEQKSFIDVGAGNGFFLEQVTATDDRSAVEIWEKQLTHLKAHFPTVHLFKNIYEVVRTYDVVACIDVLHHIENNVERAKFITALLRLVKPGGLLIVKEMRSDLLIHKYVNRLSDFLSTKSHTNEMPEEELLHILKENNFTIRVLKRYTALLYAHYYLVAQKTDIL